MDTFRPPTAPPVPRDAENKRRTGPDRIVDTFVPFNGLPGLLYEKERCDRNHHGLRWTTTVPVQEALSALLDGLTGEPDKNLMIWSVRKLFCTS